LKKRSEKVVLLIVDPQVDFHPKYEGRWVPPEALYGHEHDPAAFAHEEGTLPIKGANEDSERIAKMILENIDRIDEIYVTMDSHHVCTVYFLNIVHGI
jgi:hypothetical protein